MLAADVAHSAAQDVNPRDVIVAIIGGTMLTLALTRPRLRWVERLTDDSEAGRRWAERVLTVFAFVMAGYAWASLFFVLHKQLGWEVDTMLRGAGYFLIVYAWLVHFEPFVAEWRLGGWAGAISLYTGVAVFAASVGVMIANSLLTSSFGDARLLLVSGAVAAGGALLYKLMPRVEALVDRL
jgi:hypothetical protein